MSEVVRDDTQETGEENETAVAAVVRVVVMVVVLVVSSDEQLLDVSQTELPSRLDRTVC